MKPQSPLFRLAIGLAVSLCGQTYAGETPSFRHDCKEYVAHWTRHYLPEVPYARNIDETKREQLAETRARGRLADAYYFSLQKDSTVLEAMLDKHRRLFRRGIRSVGTDQPTHVMLAAGRNAADTWLQSWIRDQVERAAKTGAHSITAHYFSHGVKPTGNSLDLLTNILAIEHVIARYLEEFHGSRFELSLPPRLYRPNELATIQIAHSWAALTRRGVFYEAGINNIADYVSDPLGMNSYLESEAKTYDTLDLQESTRAERGLARRLARPAMTPFRPFLELYLQTVYDFGLPVIYPIRDLNSLLDDWTGLDSGSNW